MQNAKGLQRMLSQHNANYPNFYKLTLQKNTNDRFIY